MRYKVGAEQLELVPAMARRPGGFYRAPRTARSAPPMAWTPSGASPPAASQPRSSKRISPTPLLMVVAALDHLTPADLALEAYQRAREPKKLVLLPGGHFDAYVKDFETASGAARDWFLEHLGSSG